MSGKAGEIINKVIGAGMMLGSAGFFADVMANPPFLIPGFIFAAGGFFLILRHDRSAAAIEPRLQERVEQRVEQLAEGLAATQVELSATQERLDRLSEERDFMRQLASGAPAREIARPLPPPGAPRPPQAGALASPADPTYPTEGTDR